MCSTPPRVPGAVAGDRPCPQSVHSANSWDSPKSGCFSTEGFACPGKNRMSPGLILSRIRAECEPSVAAVTPGSTSCSLRTAVGFERIIYSKRGRVPKVLVSRDREREVVQQVGSQPGCGLGGAWAESVLGTPQLLPAGCSESNDQQLRSPTAARGRTRPGSVLTVDTSPGVSNRPCADPPQPFSVPLTGASSLGRGYLCSPRPPSSTVPLWLQTPP